MMHKFRVWRSSENRFDFFDVGQEATINDDDVVQLGSGFIDNAGVEVFEGDRVTANESGRVDSVVFCCGCFCLEEAMMHYEATYWGHEIKVVGHIFDGNEDS